MKALLVITIMFFDGGTVVVEKEMDSNIACISAMTRTNDRIRKGEIETRWWKDHQVKCEFAPSRIAAERRVQM